MISHRTRTLFVSLALGFCVNTFASEGIDDVIKLSHAGLSQDVMLAFVQTNTIAYELSADEIQKLRDGGVSATVIVAMLDHGKELRGGAAAPAPAPVASTNPNSTATNYDGNAAVPITQPQADYTSQPTSNYAPAETTTVVAPPENDTNISFFYEALSPHGRWHQTSFGWAWQPSLVEVDAGWRPYANGGHWVWSDHGWYWESSYPWGWAAFHYGRWNHDGGLGWVWVPDTTWGPAWVNWRQGEQYYGWAPLPSEARFEAGAGFSFRSKHVGLSFDFGLSENDYAFVSADRFLEPELSVAIVAPSHARNAYRQTTIVNNTYIYNDNRVINNGVPVAQVAQRTNRTIDAVRIADAHVVAGAAIRGEVHSRDTITVYRPAITAATPRDPRAVVAHSTYLRRETLAYPTVTNSSERDAQRRLTAELSQRRAPTPATAAPGRIEHEDAAQRRLDAELATRERAKAAKPAPTREERVINEPAANQDRRVVREVEPRDDKHAEKDAKESKDNKKDKHHHGDD